jgi:hypothetical protein
LQLRDEQGLLDFAIELAQELARAAVTAERHGAETFSGQLAEALFGERNGTLVGAVELVSGVACAIHNNLDSHGFTLLTCLLRGQPTPARQISQRRRAADVLRLMARSKRIVPKHRAIEQTTSKTVALEPGWIGRGKTSGILGPVTGCD